jgi:hypothetical protein
MPRNKTYKLTETKLDDLNMEQLALLSMPRENQVQNTSVIQNGAACSAQYAQRKTVQFNIGFIQET